MGILNVVFWEVNSVFGKYAEACLRGMFGKEMETKMVYIRLGSIF